jgi:hypothetical protein
LAGIGSAGFLYADNHPNNSWSYYPAYVVSIVTESLRLSWSAGIPNERICYLQLKKKIGRPRGRSAEKLTEMAQKTNDTIWELNSSYSKLHLLLQIAIDALAAVRLPIGVLRKEAVNISTA